MPRPADPANAAAQKRQRRWRRGLKENEIPEGCHVDVAVAAAITAYSAHLMRTGMMTPARREVIDGILDAARTMLIADGHSEAGVRSVLLRRTTRWQHDRVISDLIRKAGLAPHDKKDGIRKSRHS